jgi:hypothetical protein
MDADAAPARPAFQSSIKDWMAPAEMLPESGVAVRGGIREGVTFGLGFVFRNLCVVVPSS